MGRHRKIQLGDKFGHVTVVEFSGKAKRGAGLYRIECDCGRSSIVRGQDLKSPRRQYCSKQCKLFPRKGIPVDLVGKKFNNFLVMSFDKNRNGYKHWVCRCDCGKVSSITTSPLVGLKYKYCRYCRAQKYFTEDERKEAYRGYYQKYRRNNPAKVSENNNRRSKLKTKASPPWLTKVHWQMMKPVSLQTIQEKHIRLIILCRSVEKQSAVCMPHGTCKF